MKKIGVLMALMLVVIVFCGKKNEIDKILPSGGKKAAQSKELIQQNLNSYNKNIKIYNRILELDKELLYYFEDTGTEETFKKPVQELTVNIPLNQALIDRIKEVSKSPKPTELDKKAGEMIPVLEEMLPVITEMNNYYGGKLYQKDNYKKAQELHSKMIKITEKYNVIANKYEETFQANARDVRENKMQDFVKNKEFTDYNQFIFIRNSEDFVKEISRQNLDASNFTEGNIKEFKVLQEKVNKSLDVFRKTLKNSKQLKKEGFEKEDFDPFITKASAFKRTMDEFVKKMEKKEKASHSASSDSYFAQSEEGTPENILKSYNELIAERNKILEKKASKKS
jgi:hypothetical protein